MKINCDLVVVIQNTNIEITIELLREMIVDDKALIKEFEMQKRKKKMIGNYFLRYLDRQAKKSNP